MPLAPAQRASSTSTITKIAAPARPAITTCTGLSWLASCSSPDECRMPKNDHATARIDPRNDPLRRAAAFRSSLTLPPWPFGPSPQGGASAFGTAVRCSRPRSGGRGRADVLAADLEEGVRQRDRRHVARQLVVDRSEEHTSELQSPLN